MCTTDVDSVVEVCEEDGLLDAVGWEGAISSGYCATVTSCNAADAAEADLFRGFVSGEGGVTCC